MPVDGARVARGPGERAALPTDVADQLAGYRQALRLVEGEYALDVAVWFHAGISRQAAGDIDAAVSCFKKVIELAPDDPWAYRELAELYAAQADPRPAVVVLSTLAERLAGGGRWSDAARAWARAAELSPDDMDVLRGLRGAAERAGHHHDAARADAAIQALRERLAAAAAGPEAEAAPRVEIVTRDAGGVHEAAPARPAEPGPRPAGGASGSSDGVVEILPQPPAVHNGAAPGGPPLPRLAPGPAAEPASGDGYRVRRTRTGLLEDILLAEGWTRPEQLREALQLQQRNRLPIGQILIEMGALTEEQLARALALQWGLPYTGLPEGSVDPEVAHLIPAYLARRHGVIPVRRNAHRLVVAMSDPSNVLAIDDIRLVTGLDVDILVASPSDILRIHPTVYGGQADIEEMLKASGMEAETIEDVGRGDEVALEHLRTMVEDAPIVKAVSQILTQAVLAEASDVHIEPHHREVKVRFRLDGILHDFMTPPKAVQAALISRVKILANMDIAERRLPQDGHIHLRANGKEMDLRVSTLPTVLGEKVVLRILDHSRTKVTLPQLGFGGDLLAAWESLITKPYGLILVTGPTGSGKTTTLYTSLGRINTPERNIVSVEDPVEYQIPRVNQVQVNPKIGLSFANGLRTILRQDPDVVLIGEIRDRETAEIAVQASMTGHLVLSTVHTNDAAGAVTRLVDMGIEPFLITSSAIGVLAQRLVRVICDRCKEAYVPPADALRRLGVDPGDAAEGTRLYRGKGCDACRRTGYRGRVGVFELMVMNEELRQLVLGRGSTDRVREAARAAGMRTLKENGVLKVLEGVTTFEEMLRVVFVND